MTAFFFSALIQKEEGDRVEKTDGFSCDETAGKGIFNDGSGTDIILTGDNKASVYGFRNSNGMPDCFYADHAFIPGTAHLPRQYAPGAWHHAGS